MKNFFFRLNSDEKIGLGHLMRCLRMARVLRSKGYSCIFCLDKNNFLKEIKHEFKIINLYKKNQKFKNQEIDAKLFLDLTKANNEFVVVDDYRLNYSWQKKISLKKNKIIVFDDFENKSNYSDYYINFKPNFYESKNFSKKILKKKNSKTLLGPSYSIIQCKNKKISNLDKNTFKIGFYLGGSGNFEKIYDVVKNLVLKLKSHNKKTQILIIPGLYSSGLKKIKIFSKKNNMIKVLNPSLGLDKVIASLQLLVSSAGTIIYESAYYKIPSLIFEVSKNQNNEIKYMEKLGHYFVLPISDIKYSKKISNLIYLMLKNQKRLKSLQINKEIKIDNNGAHRIVNNILQKKELIKTEKNIPKVLENKSNVKATYKIKKIIDNDLNDYLDARNLTANRNASIKNKKIKRLDHYIWWLKNNRNSHVLFKSHKKILFLYDEILTLDDKRYSIQGWFKTLNKITLFDILYALKWQKKNIENKKNIHSSLGIIKNNNPINLSKYLSWKKLDNQLLEVIKLKQIYGISENEFSFYVR